jgi:hypothetical protein
MSGLLKPFPEILKPKGERFELFWRKCLTSINTTIGFERFRAYIRLYDLNLRGVFYGYF